MTLHDAIEKLLLQAQRPMTAREIADDLNKNIWYIKGDLSQISPSQITARANNYQNLFEINRSVSPLKIKIYGRPNQPLTEPVLLTKAAPTISVDESLAEKMLMNEKNFKSAASIDNLVVHNSGLYCIRISDINKLPKPFNNFLRERQHNIIYIGIATGSLNKRFLKQELRAN